MEKRESYKCMELTNNRFMKPKIGNMNLELVRNASPLDMRITNKYMKRKTVLRSNRKLKRTNTEHGNKNLFIKQSGGMTWSTTYC